MVELDSQGATGRYLDYKTQYSKDILGTWLSCGFFTTSDFLISVVTDEEGVQDAEEGNKDTCGGGTTCSPPPPTTDENKSTKT